MNSISTPEPVVTEEPLPGWQRVEVIGSTPFYKSPFPRTIITSNAKLKDFLRKEHSAGRLVGVNGEQFSFKRRLGLQRSFSATPAGTQESFSQLEDENTTGGAAENAGAAGNAVLVAAAESDTRRGVVELLTRDPEVAIDHRKLLSKEAKKIDRFRPENAYETPTNFEEWKRKVSGAADLKELLTMITEEDKINDALAVLFSDICLAEVSQINSNSGPMVEFPPSVNEVENLSIVICILHNIFMYVFMLIIYVLIYGVWLSLWYFQKLKSPEQRPH